LLSHAHQLYFCIFFATFNIVLVLDDAVGVVVLLFAG
jgi:hypothetical protein